MRRKSDRFQARILMLAIVLNGAIGILAAFLGYRAIKISLIAIETLDTYNDLMQEVVRRRTKSLLPEGY